MTGKPHGILVAVFEQAVLRGTEKVGQGITHPQARHALEEFGKVHVLAALSLPGAGIESTRRGVSEPGEVDHDGARFALPVGDGHLLAVALLQLAQ